MLRRPRAPARSCRAGTACGGRPNTGIFRSSLFLRRAQAVAGVGLIGPWATLTNGSVARPVNASPAYVAGCDYEDVTACIPGHGCGAPNVFLLGGGATNRTTPSGQNMW
jgi:hypothetical protein